MRNITNEEFNDLVTKEFNRSYVSHAELLHLKSKYDIAIPNPIEMYKSTNVVHKDDIGTCYYGLISTTSSQSINTNKKQLVTIHNHQVDVPKEDPNFVPCGIYKDVLQIIKSGIFYPTFITGLSGNGKTLSVEQACAKAKREMIRINLTSETDEDDLLGGFRLINNETVFAESGLVTCLRRGGVCLLDELDLATPRVMCLQSILEGKGVYLKKTGEHVYPAKGFTIFATGNTKGKGSETGQFIGTNILNEAFLDRFKATLEQSYPDERTEKRILSNVVQSYKMKIDEYDQGFIDSLVKWSTVIRKTFEDGGVDELISTRRLVDCITTYVIFNSKEKAIELCTNRFDLNVMSRFRDLYGKLDENYDEKKLVEEVSSEEPKVTQTQTDFQF